MFLACGTCGRSEASSLARGESGPQLSLFLNVNFLSFFPLAFHRMHCNQTALGLDGI